MIFEISTRRALLVRAFMIFYFLPTYEHMYEINKCINAYDEYDTFCVSFSIYRCSFAALHLYGSAAPNVVVAWEVRGEDCEGRSPRLCTSRAPVIVTSGRGTKLLRRVGGWCHVEWCCG
jgi:hypothetical protein